MIMTMTTMLASSNNYDDDLKWWWHVVFPTQSSSCCIFNRFSSPPPRWCWSPVNTINIMSSFSGPWPPSTIIIFTITDIFIITHEASPRSPCWIELWVFYCLIPPWKPYVGSGDYHGHDHDQLSRILSPPSTMIHPPAWSQTYLQQVSHITARHSWITVTVNQYHRDQDQYWEHQYNTKSP